MPRRFGLISIPAFGRASPWDGPSPHHLASTPKAPQFGAGADLSPRRGDLCTSAVLSGSAICDVENRLSERALASGGKVGSSAASFIRQLRAARLLRVRTPSLEPAPSRATAEKLGGHSECGKRSFCPLLARVLD